MSNVAVLQELGRRIRVRRLELDVSQANLAEQAGVSRSSIQQLEAGKGVRLAAFVRVLRALHALDELDIFLQDHGPSPLQLAMLHGKDRKRASRKNEDDVW